MNDRRLIPVRIDNHKPLRDMVFESLRDAIINNTLKPGERLMEIQLAEEMGVSRTPIREAIRKLELEGFITIIPRKGAHVAEISLEDIHEVYEIRTALESLAARLAADRATPEQIEEMKKCLIRETESLESDSITDTVDADIGFHELIYQGACNERLLTTLANLREQIYRLRIASMSLPGRKNRSSEEHGAIWGAISVGNSQAAQELMAKHIEFAEQSMTTYLKKTYEMIS